MTNREVCINRTKLRNRGSFKKAGFSYNKGNVVVKNGCDALNRATFVIIK